MSVSLNNDCYVVIIGDVIDSKKIANRNEVQKKLKEVLGEINNRYEEDIVAKFMISLGDEFQGLIKNKGEIIKIITELERELAPVKLRFGVGIGNVSTDINLNNSLEIDGPAYYRARKMMQELEKKKSQYTESDSNIMVRFSDEKSEINELTNAALAICATIKTKWSNRQKEIINVYLANDENQYKTAENLNIAQSSVNRALNNASFYAYKLVMDSVEDLLEKEGG